MSGSAWIMMLGTWGVIIGFTGYFFWKVLATPHGKLDSDNTEE